VVEIRPLWKGSISFGLVNIPVKLYPATGSKSISFRNLHQPCKTPLRYKKVCEKCGKEVSEEEIIKGYEYEKDSFVIITPEDLEKIPKETTKTINIVDFIDLTEVDPVYFDRTYYLAPGETGEKAYSLLQHAMEETGKIGLARLVIRTRQNLAAIRVYDGYLALETMYYPDEVRGTGELPSWNGEANLNSSEIKMARDLIENLTATFQPEKYRDEYRRELTRIIEAKIAGEEVTLVEQPEQGTVVDLMEALKASVEATQQQEGKEHINDGVGEKGEQKQAKQGGKKKKESKKRSGSGVGSS